MNRLIAGLCNGSTADSDSVCEGSNPSPAAKRLPQNCNGSEVFLCLYGRFGLKKLRDRTKGF